MSAVNIWQKLKKKSEKTGRPLLVLAPMADVTDAAFRKVIAKYGKPDAMWTEFVSADGLALAQGTGLDKLKRHLLFSKKEKPIIAQFFTSNPDYMEKASRLAFKMDFDGVDINMGCPDRGVEKGGGGAAMIKNPERAKEVYMAAVKGAGGLPVSIKTRIGYNKNEIETWLPRLLELNPPLITLHARTRKEMSLVPARWEHVKRAVELRDKISPNTLIFGNGDALNVQDAIMKAKTSGVDGVMLGRAIFGNPWLFKGIDKNVEANGATNLSLKEKFKVMLEHTKTFEKLLGDVKNFAVMRKHYKAYVNGFDGAAELRAKLMEAPDYKTVKKIVNEFLKGL